MDWLVVLQPGHVLYYGTKKTDVVFSPNHQILVGKYWLHETYDFFLTIPAAKPWAKLGKQAPECFFLV